MVFISLVLLHRFHLLRKLLVVAQKGGEYLTTILGRQLDRVHLAVLAHHNLEFVALWGMGKYLIFI